MCVVCVVCVCSVYHMVNDSNKETVLNGVGVWRWLVGMQ